MKPQAESAQRDRAAVGNAERPRAGYVDWGVVDYAVALERQQVLFDRLVAAKCGGGDAARSDGGDTARSDGGDAAKCGGGDTARSDGGDASDREGGWLIFCEHPHVYTLGRSGRAENLLVDEEFLRARGATLHRIGRGGDITYHGPGQIVGYPIVDLDRLGLGLREYIAALEQAVIDTLAEFGITAGRVEGKTGVWIGGERNEADGRFSRKPERKICAIGVKASRGVVMHGFALNVATGLEWFGMINPCGMAGSAVTSLERETGRRIALDEVKKLLAERLAVNLKVLLG